MVTTSLYGTQVVVRGVDDGLLRLKNAPGRRTTIKRGRVVGGSESRVWTRGGPFPRGDRRAP
ncbi:hypothetical protein GCM10022224_091050 [Nonomuraea antimicrobica]|uniref:Uncharacterized protein n=1 Tax=Nonomuraea antimicrobica TaxID=561173 RepID=A0ABP7DXB7_9ACTN